jgi:hypothetical protein
VRRRLGPRFGAEAGLIAAAAALAALLELDWPGIVATVFGAWLAIALFEVVWSRTRPAAAEGERPTADAAVAPEPARWAPAPPAVAAPTPVAPRPPPAPERPVQPPVAPAPRAAPQPPPPQPARVEPPPPPPAEPEPPRVAAGAPRSWNLWELERAARGLAGQDVVADEERQYMLLYLRDFASADGKLPIDFDPLVREVFGEELVVAS